MTLGEEAKVRLDEHEGEGCFNVALWRCAMYGCLIIKPDLYIIMAEAVLTDGQRIVAHGPDCPKNCWWIWYAGAPAGTASASDFISEAPFLYPFIAFKRRGKMKIYPHKLLRKDIKHGRRTVSTSTGTS